MNYQHSVYEPKSPRSMQSPLDSVALFKKTKRNGWEYSKKDSKTPRGYTGPVLDIAELTGKVPEKVCKIKTRVGSSVYRFPNGLVINGMEQTKIAGRRLGFTSLRMGAVKINL